MATVVEQEKKEKPISIRKDTLDPAVLALHIVLLTIFGGAALVLTVVNFLPKLQPSQAPKADSAFTIPKLEEGRNFFRKQAVQQGRRYKPFETACQEVVREITSRNHLLGHDAVAVVLNWMLELNPNAAKRRPSQWDGVAFILCDHHEVRNYIYCMQDDGELCDLSELSEDVKGKLHDKYISPNELKEFKTRYDKVSALYPEKEVEWSEALKNKIHEAFHRLRLYQAIRAPYPAENERRTTNRFAFAALDTIRGASWFAIDELRLIDKEGENSEKWFALMKDRVKEKPQLYIQPEHQQALKDFQMELKAGNGPKEVEKLGSVLAKHRKETAGRYARLRTEANAADGKEKTAKETAAEELVTKVLITWLMDGNDEERDREFRAFYNRFEKVKNDPEEARKELSNFLAKRDEFSLEKLQDRIAKVPEHYDPELPKYRMIHLTYLELRYPDLYERAKNWQKPPLPAVKKIVTAHNDMGKAYRKGDAASFAAKTKTFFKTVEEVSNEVTKPFPYPGSDTIGTRIGHLVAGTSIGTPARQLLDLEMLFNRVRPFMWAWILMLGALLFFMLSVALKGRVWYLTAYGFCAVSLGFQVFGFLTRVVISGRPPVTNMYETVIWVSFMSTVFALVLELIYKRRVIGIAGSMVATLGLVLADQMPLALDPKISPLVPVLRSNFWLTIHVLTIVSSYAGATLAWGLGNVSLFLIVFKKGSRETIKMLSRYTYRAMQIAVLLLAAGTFLGGWWAAYSWGRFWGWDAKETGALVALVVYVIPLHMRFIGWIRDLGTAVFGVLCYLAILIAWYGVNFVFPAGLHAYGSGSGGIGWVSWAICLNITWVVAASWIYRYKLLQTNPSVHVS